MLCNILEVGGRNELAESKRDKKFENIKVEYVILTIQDNPNETIDLQDDNYLVDGGNDSNSDTSITLI